MDFEDRSLTNHMVTMPLFYINPPANQKPIFQTVIEIDFLNPEIKEGIILDMRLADSIYLCKAITKVQPNAKAYATILVWTHEYTGMPFGLKNPPATFQRLMNNVLTGLQGLQCFVYLDDIVIYANSIQDHEKKLTAVSNKLHDNNLKLQPNKCEFKRTEVSYLGHVVSNQGVRPNPEKVSIIKEFAVPQSPKEIKSFLCLVESYRKFIQNFSDITNFC